MPGPEPEVGVRGPAAALLLLLRRRTGLDDPRLLLAGSRERADAVLAGTLTPDPA